MNLLSPSGWLVGSLVASLLGACAEGGGESGPDATARADRDVGVDARVLADAGMPPASDAAPADGPLPADDEGIESDDASADAGLADASDDGGREPPPRLQCDDRQDNDQDGLVDVADPDCSSEADPTEGGGNPATECSNGVDDDGDGVADFPFDPGCHAAGDPDETDPEPAAACGNQVDDDGDGVIDFPLDPGCVAIGDRDETDPEPPSACANGLDDDGNGQVDFPADPGCSSAGDFLEAPPCGPGVEVVDLNAHLEANEGYLGDLTGAGGEQVGSCGGGAGGEQVFAYRVHRRLDRLAFSTRHPETFGPTVLYLKRRCLAPADLVCARGPNAADPGATIAIEGAEPGLYFLVVDTGSRQTIGEFYLTVEAVAPPECRDGADNDGDGRVDAADPGCEDPEDPDEADPAEPPACLDGADNDGDGLIDYPADPDCRTAGGAREAPLCALEGVPVVRVGPEGGEVELPPVQGAGAASASCDAAVGAEAVVILELRDPSDVRVEIRSGAEAANVAIHVRTDCADPATEVACQPGQGGGALQMRGLERGRYFVFVEQGFVARPMPLTAAVQIESLLTECNDELDNDGDGRVDRADPGCEGGRDPSEADPLDPPACLDALDNDGDGLIDWPQDDGCQAAGDATEEVDCVGRVIGDACVGCSEQAEHYLEITPGLWACVNEVNIRTYQENNALCAAGNTPATFDLVNALMLQMPDDATAQAFGNWYRALPVNGDTTYIRTGQKRRGGCEPEAHGDLYVRTNEGITPGSGWHDLFMGGGSCQLPTSAANNMSHALVGVVCVEGEWAPPHR